MSKNPEISIIIPSYNRKELLEGTLQSIREQTHSNWECLIVDDGSTDATSELVEEMSSIDTRFTLYRRPEDRLKGAPSCRNVGLQNAIGTWVMFLDSDDLLHRDCLRSRLEQTDDTLDFAVFQSCLFRDRPENALRVPNWLHKPNSDLDRFISYDYPWNVSAPLLRRASLKSWGIEWKEDLPFHQDLHFYLSVLLMNPTYRKVDGKPDVYIRMGHPDKLSSTTAKASWFDGKLRYYTAILSLLDDAGRLDQERWLRVYGLMVETGMQCDRDKVDSLVNLLTVHGKMDLAKQLPPDIRFASNRNHPWRRWTVFRHSWGGARDRLAYLPPTGSTLGKISLSQYLESLQTVK